MAWVCNGKSTVCCEGEERRRPAWRRSEQGRSEHRGPGLNAADSNSTGPAGIGHIVLRLDRIMVERGRSLNWLADQVGITNVNLSKIKNNRVSAIRFSTLAAICAALDCQPGDILEYVDGISGDADDANSK